MSTTFFQEWFLDTRNSFAVLDKSVQSTDPVFTPTIHSTPCQTRVKRVVRALRRQSTRLSDVLSSRSSRSTSPASSQASMSTIALKGNNLRTLIANANGIRTKLATLEAACDYLKPDVLIISETKVIHSVSNQEIVPEQFASNCFRHDRSFHGGGVLIAVREGISCVPVDTPHVKDSEQVWVKIMSPNKPDLYIGSFYRPPSAGDSPLIELEATLTNLPVDKTLILGGDFNCREIDWVRLTSNGPSHCHKLLDICNDFSLNQMNHKPTRLGSILELHLTNNPSLVRNCSIAPGFSDHDGMIVTDTDIQPVFNKSPPRKVPLYKSADWNLINEKAELFKENYLLSCKSSSVETNWKKIKLFVQNIMENYVPHKTLTRKNHLPWFDRQAKSLVRKKQKLYNCAKKSGKPEDWDSYREIRSAVNKHLAERKNAHISNILKASLENNNTKPFWRHIKALRRDNIGVAPLINEGELHSDPGLKADLLSQQFESVFVHDSDQIGTPILPGTPFPNISNLLISEGGILKLLKGLDISKASGPDQIPNKILRELAIHLAPVLTSLFNQSLLSETLPSDWKTANVTPVFKKGNRSLASNYRPISLVCVACKLLEHCIVSQVMPLFDHIIF